MATTNRDIGRAPTDGDWRTRWHKFQRKYAPYIFVSPFFILFAVFGLFPILFSIYLSFQLWDPIQGLGTMEFVGIENYIFLFTDPWFWQALFNTFWIAIVSGLPQHLIAIPLAFVLVVVLPQLRGFFTGAYFLPYIASTVAVALIFATIYGLNSGILNAALIYLANAPWSAWLFGGLKDTLPINWLGNAFYVKPAISVMVFWKFFGFNLVLYSAGLATVPREYYEAAEVDGANIWQRFYHISLPLLRPVMFFAITLSIIGNLQLFEEPFILTGGTGGPARSGLTVAMYLYRTGFNWSDMGTAAAMSWVLFFIIGIFSAIQFFFLGRRSLETRD